MIACWKSSRTIKQVRLNASWLKPTILLFSQYCVMQNVAVRHLSYPEPRGVWCVVLASLPSPSMHGNAGLRSVVIHAVATSSVPVSGFLSVKNCTLLGLLRLQQIALKSWWRSLYCETDCQFFHRYRCGPEISSLFSEVIYLGPQNVGLLCYCQVMIQYVFLRKRGGCYRNEFKSINDSFHNTLAIKQNAVRYMKKN